jgi:hypothetical protein
MIKSTIDDDQDLAVESPLKKRVWQPPRVYDLKPDDIESGTVNVREVSGGVLNAS